jgi:uncharacterized protein YjbI with pentapeptide repeats/PKD repeat protein
MIIVQFNITTETPSAIVSILPLIAYSVDNLQCYATLTDMFETNLVAQWTIYKNEISIASGTTDVINGTNTLITTFDSPNEKHSNWSCSVIPYDGFNNGTEVNSTIIEIQNTAPVSSLFGILSWDRNQNATIDLNSYFSDADGDALNFIASAVQNITVQIDNVTGIATFIPDAGWYGQRNVNFTAFDTENANVLSNNLLLDVGYSTIVDSWINDVLYNGIYNYSDIPGLYVSTINISNITGILDITESYAYNATIIDSTLFNCTIIDSLLEGSICLNAYIDPSRVRYSNVTGSTIKNSIIEYSNATYSTIENSAVYNSNFNNFTLTDSGLQNVDGLNSIIDDSNANSSTITDSNVSDSTVSLSEIISSNLTNATLNLVNLTNSVVENSNFDNTVINDANITDGIIYSGTIVDSNGITYNATDSGQLNLVDLINYAPTAIISSPSNGASLVIGTDNTFVSGSIDPNIGTLLNDSLTYLWDFGDGNTSTTQNPVHSYSGLGVYNLSLTVEDIFNKSSFTEINVIVVNPPAQGGGGSSSSYRETFIDISKGETKEVFKDDTLVFIFNSNDYRLTLTGIYSKYATIMVDSLQMQDSIFSIDINKTLKLDLNKDGSYDVAVTLKELGSYSAKFYIVKIREPVSIINAVIKNETAQNITPKVNVSVTIPQNKTVETKENLFTITGKSISDFGKNILADILTTEKKFEKNWQTFALISSYAILAGIIIYLSIRLNKFVKKRKMNKRAQIAMSFSNHQELKKDVVNIEKKNNAVNTEDFVNSVVQNGLNSIYSVKSN